MSKLPNGWIEMIAEEYCDRVSDGTHDSPKKREQGKLLITSKNIKNGSLEKSSAYNISIEDYIEVNKRSNVDKWDILLSMIGTVGEVCIIKEEPDFAIKNVGLFKCSNKTDSYWLYYYLRSKFGKNYILSRLSGTTQKYITLGDLRKFPIFSPKNFEEQKAIVDVLSSLDEKIELLQEENKTLEELAQTMFKEWFVNFNYHGATGEMEDSELGEIPKGWRVFELRELITFIKGKKPKETQEDFKENFLPQILINTFDNGKIVFGLNKNVVLSLKEELLMVMDGASSGRIEFGFDGIVGSTLALIKIEKDIKSIIYFYLKQMEKDIKSNTTGSAIPHTDKERVYNYKIVLNDKSNFEYEYIFNLFRKKIVLNREQIQTLSETRDILLPKLMSGEIRVEGFGE